MFAYTNKSIGKVKDLNNRLKQQVIEQNSKGAKLRSLKTNVGFDNKRQQFGNPANKPQSILVDIRRKDGVATPVKHQSPLQKRVTMRMNTTSRKPRKSVITSMQTSFFGNVKKPLFLTPNNELEEIKSAVYEESTKSIKANLMRRGTIKAEVTIPEYDIHKKWYEYEKKIGKDFKLPSSLTAKNSFNKSSISNDYKDLSSYIGILGNLKVSKKANGNLNPLVGNTNFDAINYTLESRSFDAEETKVKFPKMQKTNLLSIRQIGTSDKSVLSYK